MAENAQTAPADNPIDLDELRAHAKIRADEHDRKTRRYLTFLLAGALFVLAAGNVALAAVIEFRGNPVPAWLSSQIPVVTQAIIAAATIAVGYNLGSSASSRGKDEKPKE